MAEAITISLNEFRALMRKAFEGVYAHRHDINALADHVLWLEYHGLSGLDIFLESCAGLEEWRSPDLQERSNGDLDIDARGQCMLALNDMVCDLVFDRALGRNMGTLHIQNALNPQVIVSGLARCKHYGLAGAAWWPGTGEWAHIAVLDGDSPVPYLCRIDLPEGVGALSATTLIVADAFEKIDAKYPEWFAFRRGHTTPANEIQQSYLSHLDHGFSLSKEKYRKICALADRVLVEATEQSRRGAGA